MGKKTIFGNFFKKNVKFLSIFWQSNGNFSEGQVRSHRCQGQLRVGSDSLQMRQIPDFFTSFNSFWRKTDFKKSQICFILSFGSESEPVFGQLACTYPCEILFSKQLLWWCVLISPLEMTRFDWSKGTLEINLLDISFLVNNILVSSLEKLSFKSFMIFTVERRHYWFQTLLKPFQLLWTIDISHMICVIPFFP